jgi:hypothetical protein
MTRFPLAGLALVLALGAAAEEPAEPDADGNPYTEEVTVTGRADDLVGIADSATQGTIGARDLATRPILRPGELLEAIPGVIVTQHSGAGKANQYFLRGFNLDHGTDLRTSVEGVGVNMPSHGHGQGYTDLSFLVPELVSRESFTKGPYDAEAGDFSAAGAVDIELVDSVPAPLLEATPGTLGFLRAVAADSISIGTGTLLGAFEYAHSDGPWVNPDDYTKINGVVRYSRVTPGRRLALTAMAYDGSWSSTDQVPLRAVNDGTLDRFGTVDPSDGGESSRASLQGEYLVSDGVDRTRVRAYALRYDLELFSNFTYFLDDPVNGDQFEQADRRFVAGFDVDRVWNRTIASRDWTLTAGLQVRRDDITNGLFDTKDQVRLATTREDEIVLWGGGPFAEARVAWTPTFRMTAGARVDWFDARVDSSLAENSGSADDALVSPKLSFVLGPWSTTEYYVNLGYGFHSNDARGATIRVDPATGEAAEPVDPLVRARGADVGVRTRIADRLESTVSAFVLDIDSELLFVGDAGITEPSRPSRREGFEITNFYKPVDWLSIDLDLAYSRARFTDDDPAGDRIPGSIEGVVTAGVAVSGLRGFFGGVRGRWFGPRSLTEDDGVRSSDSTLVYAELGYRIGEHVRIGLQVFNVLDAEVSDIDYYYESRLAPEAAPVEDIHFHPAESRALRLVATFTM